MKRSPPKKAIHPLAQAVKKLFADNAYKEEAYKYRVGDQVKVRLTTGEEWIGEVCYRMHDFWQRDANLYEVSNAPSMVRGTWCPAVREYEMSLVKPFRKQFFGYDLFDKVRVEHPEHGNWTGYVLSFVRDGDESEYEVEGAPEGQDASGFWRPFVAGKHMTMITPGFPTFTDPSMDEGFT